MKHLQVTEQQVLYFRARRGFLAGQSAATVAEAASRILGAQSQLLAPSLHALSLRTQSRPTAKEIKQELFQHPRSLVRGWGLRDTLILDRGRVVGTWTQKATKKKLAVQVQPLSAWRKSKHLAAVRQEATALANHLEVQDCEVSIDE